jgi:hypothetical protein
MKNKSSPKIDAKRTAQKPIPGQRKTKPPAKPLPPKRPRGRPKGTGWNYDPVVGDKICGLIAGGSNLYRVAKIPEMPCREVMYGWIATSPIFAANYASARQDRADARADRIDEIAAKLERGEIDSNTARVLVDIEKWQAGKEKPKRYGDKLDVEATVSGEIKIIIGGDIPS